MFAFNVIAADRFHVAVVSSTSLGNSLWATPFVFVGAVFRGLK